MKHQHKGLYDQLVTSTLRAGLEGLPAHLKADIEPLGFPELSEYLAREVSNTVRQLLAQLAESSDSASILDRINALMGDLEINERFESALLTAVYDAVAAPPSKPLVPLAQSALVTNDQGLNYHRLLKAEISSSDRVDLICPFIGNQGLNLIFEGLADLGPRLRVITTTYLGGTNQRALERLAETGAQIKIVYERAEQKTSLHAKSWIFYRESGFTTATVGSSNLSPKALVDGLEWNVRLSNVDAPQVLQELIVTFERLWQNDRYEEFDPNRDGERLKRALRAQRSGEDQNLFFADLHPLPHQEEALQELAYARLEGKSKNLIVAATGTGKTLLAAFDYKRLSNEYKGRPKLLFVAHREEILKQSRAAFRAVMRDTDFGELQVAEHRADAWRHVFASVQSLSHRNLEEFAKDHFDVVVIDEFHHAEAPTYVRLLDHFTPRQLIGLTATPERADGKNVIDRFGVPTYELRLWHALDRGLLCPFHYFGVDDQTDLRDLNWTNGKYDDADLTRRYVDLGDDRVALIIRELKEKVSDLETMHVVAFCATIKHADFMTQRFIDAGLNARALHSKLPEEIKKDIIGTFRRGDLPIVCTVDMFNEGVDIPEIDTVLFLRPTESATVFIQQLGRGLRNHEGKGALTVLDFVGQQNKKFRMDLRFRAITGQSRSELERSIKEEFPSLPPGCNIKLDRTTQERVLRNIREAIPSSNKALVEELRRMKSAGQELTLANFIKETGLELPDLYKGPRTFASLKYAAGIGEEPPANIHRIGSFTHVNDSRRASAYLANLAGSGGDPATERMMAYTLTGRTDLESLSPATRAELSELLEIIRSDLPPSRPPIAAGLPFTLHALYSRDEIVGPFRGNPGSMRQGTFYVKHLGLDIHIFTLKKSDREFSPTTRYQDYFISPDRIHWESQSTTSVASETGQRLVKGLGRHLFFVRESKADQDGTAPFLCLGFANPIHHESEKPIKLIWQLEHPVPDHIYVRFSAAAG